MVTEISQSPQSVVEHSHFRLGPTTGRLNADATAKKNSFCIADLPCHFFTFVFRSVCRAGYAMDGRDVVTILGRSSDAGEIDIGSIKSYVGVVFLTLRQVS